MIYCKPHVVVGDDNNLKWVVGIVIYAICKQLHVNVAIMWEVLSTKKEIYS